MPIIDELSPSTREAFCRLQQAALSAHIDLQIASGYRSIDRQTQIWKRKAAPDYLFNLDGKQVSSAELDDKQWLEAVMTWSAVPGLSRHHWRTDIDVFDANAIPPNYRLQLTPSEYCERGIFRKLCIFLDTQLNSHNNFGFFRPYLSQNNPISREPWHLSFRAEAEERVRAITPEVALELVPFNQLRGGDILRANIESIVERYVHTYNR